MHNQGRYFLGRVHNISFSQDELISAIRNAPKITRGNYDWAITDVTDQIDISKSYIFGKLSKYRKDGSVIVIDEPSRSQKPSDTPNLLKACSPFVYVPSFSGIAYLHVWNDISEKQFESIFSAIIEQYFNNLLVKCSIERITDYLAFAERIYSLDRISEISAKVTPPNPLYGRLWERLKEQLDKRNLEEIKIKETSSKGGINSDLSKLLNGINSNPQYKPDDPPEIADAAILMAADGYGRGKVVGLTREEEITIYTSETQRSFLQGKDPSPEDLAKAAWANLEEISKSRDMSHK